jgi:hypothetical protein
MNFPTGWLQHGTELGRVSCNAEYCDWRDALRETLPLQQQDVRGREMTSEQRKGRPQASDRNYKIEKV